MKKTFDEALSDLIDAYLEEPITSTKADIISALNAKATALGEDGNDNDNEHEYLEDDEENDTASGDREGEGTDE